MNIYSLLKEDHRAVKALLKELVDTTERAEKTRSQLFKKIHKELSVHTEAEEAAFYSQVNEGREDRILIFEANDEHDLVKQKLHELSSLDITTEEWAAKAKVLKDLVEHHIEEEEGNVFTAAKKILSPSQAVEIGKVFDTLKKQLLETAPETPVHTPIHWWKNAEKKMVAKLTEEAEKAS